MNENGTSVQIAGADHDLDELESRVKSFNRGDRAAPQKSPAPEKENGFVGYLKQSLHSKIVQYGAVAIMAFGVGAYTSDNFKQSAKAAGNAVKNGIGYCVGKMFNALPAEKQKEILRENVRKMTPEELKREVDKARTEYGAKGQEKSLKDKFLEVDAMLEEMSESAVPYLREVNDGIRKLYGVKRPENAQEKK